LLLVTAAGLAMDALSVAVAVGASLPQMTARHVFRLSWHFGLFQFLMPICGYLLAHQALQDVATWGRWIAFSLLMAVGARTLLKALSTTTNDLGEEDPTRGFSLVALSLATSLDALAVGAGLAAVGIRIFYPSLVIGAVAGLFTLAGMGAGSRLGHSFGRKAGVVGGIILIGVGIKLLVSH